MYAFNMHCYSSHAGYDRENIISLITSIYTQENPHSTASVFSVTKKGYFSGFPWAKLTKPTSHFTHSHVHHDITSL